VELPRAIEIEVAPIDYAFFGGELFELSNQQSILVETWLSQLPFEGEFQEPLTPTRHGRRCRIVGTTLSLNLTGKLKCSLSIPCVERACYTLTVDVPVVPDTFEWLRPHLTPPREPRVARRAIPSRRPTENDPA
jgi:hypothetical protein